MLMGFVEYIWAESLAGQQRYQEALLHAELARKFWSTIPASITLNPEGDKRVADLNRLLADIRAHLHGPPAPLPDSNPHAN
jgi:hypothetical protein